MFQIDALSNYRGHMIERYVYAAKNRKQGIINIEVKWRMRFPPSDCLDPTACYKTDSPSVEVFVPKIREDPFRHLYILYISLYI